MVVNHTNIQKYRTQDGDEYVHTILLSNKKLLHLVDYNVSYMKTEIPSLLAVLFVLSTREGLGI